MSAAVWVVIAALILINAFYVSAEFGAVGVRRSRIRWMSDRGNGLARRLLPFIETPAGLSQYVAASQIGITFSSLMLGAYAQATIALGLTDLLADRLGAGRARSAAELGVLVLLAAIQAVLGELIPKSVALRFPAEVALATVLPMRWSLRVFRPFIAAINGTTMLLLSLWASSSHRSDTFIRQTRSICCSPKAETAGCSSRTNNSACTARFGSDAARRTS
jgi:CBS domain containing-hemolysin-like protein